MDKIQNNVTRYLTNKKITFESLALGSDEKFNALEVAEILHVSTLLVYKTIVLKRSSAKGKPVLTVIPANKSVDLKKTAQFLEEKKIQLPTQAEAEHMTGLLSGGISPLALINKGFDVLIDSSAKELQSIIISGGQRGLQIRLNPYDLQNCVNARFCHVTGDES